LEEAEANHWLVTGLIYINPLQPTLFDNYNLPDEPLNRMKEEQLRPAPETLDAINASMG
jgi:2-oxoglutarate ferredoxin oxidoreductase subunit beta